MARPGVGRLDFPPVAFRSPGVEQNAAPGQVADAFVLHLHRRARLSGDEVAPGHRVRAGREGPRPACQSAVEDSNSVMAEVAQRPPQPARREPVLIVVDDDRAVAVDARVTQGCLERMALGERMPPSPHPMPGEPLGLQIDEHGTGDVTGLVARPPGLALQPAEIDHPEARIAQVGTQPGGVDERSDRVHAGAHVR